jgi:hypothetical protein
MLPEPVNHAAQLLAMAMPAFARNAYRMALAVEPFEEVGIDDQLSVNAMFPGALLLVLLGSLPARLPENHA